MSADLEVTETWRPAAALLALGSALIIGAGTVHADSGPGDLAHASFFGPFNDSYTVTGYTGGSGPANGSAPIGATVLETDSWIEPPCGTQVCLVYLNQGTAAGLPQFGVCDNPQAGTPCQVLSETGPGVFAGTIPFPGGCDPTKITLTVTRATRSIRVPSGWEVESVAGTVLTPPSANPAGCQPGQDVQLSFVGTERFPQPSPSPTAPGGTQQPPRPTPTPASAGGGHDPVNPPQSPFGTSLPRPGAAFAARSFLINAVIAIALVLFITFPSQLFNRTYEENQALIRKWWERPTRWVRRPPFGPNRLLGSHRHALGLISVVVCGGVLGALLDPGFGGNPRTLALGLGIALAITVGMTVAGLSGLAYRRWRHLETHWEPRALPSGLLVAVFCVLVSRVTSFQPGYLYGLIGGVAFAGRLTPRQEGHAVATVSATTLVVSLIAWLAWIPIDAAASRPGAGFVLALIENFLAAMFVSGLVGLVIGLVPLRFLPGEKLAAWHKGVWGAGFAVALLALLQVFLRPQTASAHATSTPFWTTIGLFIGFGAASVAFWGYFRVRGRTPSNVRAPHPRP